MFQNWLGLTNENSSTQSANSLKQLRITVFKILNDLRTLIYSGGVGREGAVIIGISW